eukprot:CAMPEP_0195029920 /NCGR_PEP_ID=MMETSP0326_2-20130528/57765_1 /TAXON_ID=2866 ORGANISM="Crypthecodinium cohnii, Strain Seligo" /NCGR_SAMPLE_ID=MMETSP0326_2 /ASSEMBLY_ACC=CAM_ASM_000348 /LENGTH=85 /DNA_ID=CAMNT_0040053013 /DNA_START=280 /DNA_END=534 /DNA_ORIENTATION=+
MGAFTTNFSFFAEKEAFAWAESTGDTQAFSSGAKPGRLCNLTALSDISSSPLEMSFMPGSSTSILSTPSTSMMLTSACTSVAAAD